MGRVRGGSRGLGGAARLVGLRGEVAEVFSAELAVHAPGVDAEEESTEDDEAQERGDGAEEMALGLR